MGSKNIGIKQHVYERLKAHKRGDKSFSETLDRILQELDSDWRTNVGFLTDDEAAEFEAEVTRTPTTPWTDLGTRSTSAFRKSRENRRFLVAHRLRQG